MSSEPEAPRGAPPWLLPVGLIGLIFWLLGGLLLESFHGFKFAAYLMEPNRRLTWTLAHAHGTLLSVVCLVLWMLIPRLSISAGRANLAAKLFASGAMVLPLGFLAGGLLAFESDPGIPVIVVPVGALLCATSIALLLRRQP